ncbi:hypothetical protein PG985_002166 [Apiospora marii]|uniref:Uncharacterized protein n=1 Tax=Apiospora marii TaxID=335849 RepID=A0ABR1RYT2_9PEZI
MDDGVENVDPDLGRSVILAGVGDVPVIDGQPLLERTVPGKRVRVEGEPHAPELEERIVLIESATLGNVKQNRPCCSVRVTSDGLHTWDIPFSDQVLSPMSPPPTGIESAE